MKTMIKWALQIVDIWKKNIDFTLEYSYTCIPTALYLLNKASYRKIATDDFLWRLCTSYLIVVKT